MPENGEWTTGLEGVTGRKKGFLCLLVISPFFFFTVTVIESFFVLVVFSLMCYNSVLGSPRVFTCVVLRLISVDIRLFCSTSDS